MSTVSMNGTRDLAAAGLKRLSINYPTTTPILTAYINLSLHLSSLKTTKTGYNLFIDLSDTLTVFCRREHFHDGRTFSSISTESVTLIDDIDEFLSEYSRQGVLARAVRYQRNRKAFKKLYKRLDMLDLRLRCLAKYRPILRDYKRYSMPSGDIRVFTADSLGIIDEDVPSVDCSRESAARRERSKVQSLVALPNEQPRWEMLDPTRFGESPRASRKSLASIGSTHMDISSASCRVNRGESFLSLVHGRGSSGSHVKERSQHSSPLAPPLVNGTANGAARRDESMYKDQDRWTPKEIGRTRKYGNDVCKEDAETEFILKWLDEIEDPEPENLL